jgi:hypothetical protein
MRRRKKRSPRPVAQIKFVLNQQQEPRGYGVHVVSEGSHTSYHSTDLMWQAGSANLQKEYHENAKHLGNQPAVA